MKRRSKRSFKIKFSVPWKEVKYASKEHYIVNGVQVQKYERKREKSTRQKKTLYFTTKSKNRRMKSVYKEILNSLKYRNRIL